MRCPKCGAENATGKILCRVCGARLRPASVSGTSAGPAPYESDEDLRRWLTFDLTRIVWVMAAVIVVGLGLGFLVR